MSNIKEPYSISVWEEELIPVQDWYVLKEDTTQRLAKEEYLALTETEKQNYELHTIMEHYEETQGIIIGAHDMDSVYAAVNPILKKNVNGSVDLTFGLYYKVFDPDCGEFMKNPFTQLLVNEAKVKLHFRGKWYDLVVKSCVEDSTNFLFNYTCKDIYVNELNKNGFKVELDTELENNQAIVTELAETILLDTDWQVDKAGSDILVETKIEPLYIGTLNQDVTVERVSDFTPDDYADMTGQWTSEVTIEDSEGNKKKVPVENIIINGSKVLFFYSDVSENVKQPQLLARLTKTKEEEIKEEDKVIKIKYFYSTIDPDNEQGIKSYDTDANEDIIINSYNYQIVNPAVYYVDSELEYNIPSITTEKVDIYDCARGEKVIKSQLSGYDPDLDQFIFKFYKKDDNGINPVEYYGYAKTEHLTSDLAQNYLANSDNFTSLESGWYFDGVPAKTVKTRGKEKTAAYSGQIFSVADPTKIGEDMKNGQESVLVLQLRNEEGNRTYYPDTQGEFYLVRKEKYVKIGSTAGTNFATEFKNKFIKEYKEKNPDATDFEAKAEEALKQKKYSLVSGKYEQNSDNGDYYKIDAVYAKTELEEGKVYEDSIRAWVYDQRDYYVEGYADKTDEELDDIINELLLSNRYSYRSRYAVNTGVAANRQTIQTLTPGEEYLFAVSLGKFTETEENTANGADPGPVYCTTTEDGKNIYTEIQYGGKVPTEFYSFSSSTQHHDFIIKAVREALGDRHPKKDGKEDTTQDLWSNKYKDHKYYYHHPEYEKIYTSTYNAEVEKAEKEYEDKFLFGLNSVNSDARDLWKSGGKKYRNEIFLEYLRGNRTFSFNGNSTTNFCEYLATAIKAKKIAQDNAIQNATEDEKNNYKVATEDLYDILIQQVKGTHSFTGVYPAMIQQTIDDAKEMQKDWWRIKSYWEPMVYDDTLFPTFDKDQHDIVGKALSFNEHLFCAIYQGLKLSLMSPTDITPEGTVGDLKVYRYAWNEKASSSTLTSDLETFLKTVYKAIYDEGTPIDAYNTAKEYKMPGLGYPEGGEIYRAYKARWEASAAAFAQSTALNEVDNINSLFSMPECIDLVGSAKLPTDINNNNTAPDECYDELSDLANFVQEQMTAFKQDYSMEQIEKNVYAEALAKKYPEWVEEFLNNRYPETQAPETQEEGEESKPQNHHNHTRLYGKYYYANFLPAFIEAWVSQQEIGTYVLAEDKYELNGSKIKEVEFGDNLTDGESGTLVPQLGIINADNKIKNPTAKHFVQGLYSTSPDGAEYVAIKTDYNPYTSTNDDDAGGYVFDRNDEIIRLYDPERDAIAATYKPVKSDEGDYIYDVFEQLYRPFRNWSVDEKRNPVTFESDDEKGVFGDVTKHPIKAFDGHIGSWEETPTRYKMVRLREDPIGALNSNKTLKYNYLTSEIKIGETGHYDGENYDYTVTYPVGYQTDSYVQDDDGQYILASDVKQPKRPDLYVELFGKDAMWHLLGGSSGQEKTEVYQVSDKDTKSIWQKIKDWFQTKISYTVKDENNEDQKYTDDLSEAYEDSNSGLLTSNNNAEGYYDEDEESMTVYTINDQLIAVPKLSSVANKSESKNALEKNQIDKTQTDNDGLIPTNRYIKYRPWYWRHWKARNNRYNYNPKICVQKTINGLTVFKPFNKVEDSISDDYRVKPIEDLAQDEIVAFYLKNRKQQFRTAQDIDYGARKYRMELRDKKKIEYWVESPNGEDYLRHYKRGDGEIRLWDGHFGRWIDCFEANERLTNEKIDESSGWYLNNSDYPGLAVSYKKNDKGELTKEVDMAILPVYYLPYNDIMIPWDARVLSRKERYTRQRVKYDPSKHDELYVLSDGVYKTLDEYYNDSGFINELKYDKLKVSFVTDFSYDAANFSIKDLPNNRDEYLSFDLNKAPSKEDYVDIVISETDEGTIKERWVYWKGVVKKQFSLTENPLQTIGMLFETSRTSDENGYVQSYPFLGMQMFRYIPYEKKEVKTTITEVDFSKNEKVIINEREYGADEAVRFVYNKLFGITVDNQNREIQTLLYNNNSDDIIFKLENNASYAAMVSKFFSERDPGYVWDISEPTKFEKVLTSPIKQPLFPGQPPDARDLYRLLYYIYDPEKVTDVDDVVYEYVGTEPIYDEDTNPEGQFKIAYDPLCQKVRSVKGKESNYFKLLQDCCDTFDCWVEHNIDHDPVTGQVKYIEKPVYIENNFNSGYDLNTDKETTTHTELQYEPQMYVGQDAKERALDNKIEWYKKRLGNDIVETTKEVNGKVVTQYEVAKITDEETGKTTEIELDDDKHLELKELNRLCYVRENLTVRYILVPDKKIRFRRYVGKENWNGFKYGVNLKHIKRTVDSNQISTRVIVKPNKNEHAKDNFCTIQRAHDNPIKENFLYDFSYYTQQGLLSKKELNNDLYTNLGSRLNYYNELARINKDNDKIIEELSGYLVDLDEVTANYQTAVLKRDAALEEIQKAALTMTSNYDTYGQIIDTPWTPNKSQEYITRKQTSAPASSFDTTVEMSNGETLSVTIDVPKTATAVDYPKYNDALRGLLDKMDIYQAEYTQSLADVEKYEQEKEDLERKIELLQEQQRIIVDKKNQLNKLFYHKYSRFIQEGSWVDENYIDDNLYYLDALSVMRTSCKPKITYDIGVVDIAAAYEYEEDRLVLESDIGDRTYVEDTEFFGYQEDKATPYWELVVVSEKTYNLNDPSQNQTKVKNYSTQFDDLFQRIAATSQTLQFNEGSYNRAASIMNDNGTINAEILQQSIEDSADILAWSNNEHVVSDTTGITLTNSENANTVKIVSRGIILSTDGGTSWKTAITGSGINADLLTAGRLDTKMLLIGNSDNPNFFWNDLGLSAFRINNAKVDYSSFVRLDQYGIYGIQNHDVTDKTKLSLNDTFAPRSIKEISTNPKAVFGLTWDGFFLNASNGKGKVTIGTQQDFKMSEFSDANNAWMDKVIIGRLSDKNGNEYYGFRLKNDDNQVVMETNESGELYLKRKLRISNFSDIATYDSFIYSTEPITVNGVEYTEYYKKYTANSRGANYIEYYRVNDFTTPFYTEENNEIDWRDLISDPQDRVTLGIVDVYDRGNNFNKVLTPKGTYSSSDYLTKVFSVKANGNVGLEQFTDEQIKQLIEKNENFAIFDNGNLFAKNAYIEGHVEASSGFFGGMNVYGDLIVGDKDNLSKEGRIYSANGQWSINGDGTAYFTNAVVSGTISCAIFEKEKIQVVNGSLLVAPQLTLKTIERIEREDEKYVYFIVCEETSKNGELPSNFSENDTCKIGNTVGNGIFFTLLTEPPAIEKKEEEVQLITNSIEEDIDLDDNDDFTEQNISFYALTENELDLTSILDEQQFVFCVAKNGEGTTMLSLNGQNSNSVLPEEGFAIFKNVWLEESQVWASLTKTKVGKLNISEVPSELRDTYGLYSDNAYLKGTMITQSDNYEAGVSTNGYKKLSNNNLVFWAGPTNADPIFSVTEDGVLTANAGIFRGTVEATEIHSSTIYTSKVVGFDTQTGLCFDGNGQAIRFINSTNNNEIEYYALSSSGVQQTIDLKIIDNREASLAPLVFGVETSGIVGLFGSLDAQTINDYSLAFKQEKDTNDIGVYFKGEKQMSFTPSGVKLEGNSSMTHLGTKVTVLDSINDNIIIGCDIFVED